MRYRSHFLACFSTLAALRALNEHIQPRVNPKEPDFSRCWVWTGTQSKPGNKTRIRIRYRSSYADERRPVAGETLEMARPSLFINGMGNVDARRAVFELFRPEIGLHIYRLKRFPHCASELCVNPHHFFPVFGTVNHERDYPIWISPGNALSDNLMGSWHPHQQDTPLPLLESPENRPAVDSGTVATPVPIIGTEIRDAFGSLRTGNEYYEGLGTPWAVAKNWQSLTSMFLSSVAEPIQSWLRKWDNSAPSGYTINAFSTECVNDAFSEVEAEHPAPYGLSEILSKEKFNFHPKLIMDWYAELPAEKKAVINLNK